MLFCVEWFTCWFTDVGVLLKNRVLADGVFWKVKCSLVHRLGVFTRLWVLKK
jgi:hypothetical protein